MKTREDQIFDSFRKNWEERRESNKIKVKGRVQAQIDFLDEFWQEVREGIPEKELNRTFE